MRETGNIFDPFVFTVVRYDEIICHVPSLFAVYHAVNQLNAKSQATDNIHLKEG